MRAAAIALLTLALVATTGTVAAAEQPEDPPPPEWAIDVDNRYPYLGDLVVIEVQSVYIGEYANIEITRQGVRVHQLYVRTNSTRGTEATWQTRLDMPAGWYRIALEHYGEPKAYVDVQLVYDPLDFALKTLQLHEQEMQELRDRDGLAEEWAQLALRQNDYETRWRIFGAVVNTLALIVIFYLGPEAWRKHIGKGVAKGKRGLEALLKHPDGTNVYSYGKEQMERTPPPREPAQGLSAWCGTCDRLVHVTEWRDHPHPLLHTAGEDLGSRGGPRVRPLRVVKKRRVEQ